MAVGENQTLAAARAGLGIVAGSNTLVLGTFTVSNALITSNSVVTINPISPLGTLGVGYKAVCSAGQCVVTAFIAAGTIQVLDVSILQYIIII